jgi:hypothetical protein
VPGNDPLSFDRRLGLGAAAEAAVAAAGGATGMVSGPGAPAGVFRAAGHLLVVGPSGPARLRAAPVGARAAFRNPPRRPSRPATRPISPAIRGLAGAREPGSRGGRARTPRILRKTDLMRIASRCGEP